MDGDFIHPLFFWKALSCPQRTEGIKFSGEKKGANEEIETVMTGVLFEMEVKGLFIKSDGFDSWVIFWE